MVESSLVISFSLGGDDNVCTDPSINSDDFIRLTQEDWTESENRSSDFGSWLAANGYIVDWSNYARYLDLFMAQCNDDGSFDTKIFVEKSHHNLPYQMHTTSGALTGPAIITEDYNVFETVTPGSTIFNVPDTVILDSYEWEGDSTFGACGDIVMPPTLSLDDQDDIVWDTPVFGILHIIGKIEKEYWILNAVIRDDAVDMPAGSENTNFAVVTAAWDGGVDQLIVEPPDLTKGTCSGGYGGSVIVNPDDPDENKCGNRVIKIDACTGEVISDEVVIVPCPSEEESEE